MPKLANSLFDNMTMNITAIHAPLIEVIAQAIPLNAEEIDIIQRLFKLKTYKKGTFFLAEGETCKYVGFIKKGILRYYINDDGEEKTYGFSQEAEFICNYESFVPQKPSRQIIQALEDSELLVISYRDLQQFYDKIHAGDRFGRLVIEQVFIQTLKDLNSFYTDTAPLRYENFIRQHPELQQRLSQYYIASYVGVKPQSLSRIRKRLLTS